MPRQQFQRLKFPDHAHPLVQKLFVLMNIERVGITDLSRLSGWSVRTINGWRKNQHPSLAAYADCVQAMGYELVLVRRGDPLLAEPSSLPVDGGSEALKALAIGDALSLAPGDEALHVIHVEPHGEVVELERRAPSALRWLTNRLAKRKASLV